MTNEHYARKNSRHVAIPFELTLDKYLLLDCETSNKKALDSIEKMNIESVLNLTKYSLYGIVSHSGDMNSGHYVAFIKNEEK